MTFVLKTAKNEYELAIGLEVHCEITSASKLFSRTSARFGAAPNTEVSFFDAGFPGQLPRLDEFCIEQAVRTGLGLSATINAYSVFARKHYFYADLPSGYQISQFTEPLVSGGWLEVQDDQGAPKKIRIERLHVEQDAGKLTHDADPSRSMVDLNRAGVGLMEIVSRPDLSSPREVAGYLRQLRALVRWLGTCDGNMDEGSMRCDINISLRPRGAKTLGTRTETKNVNSIRFAEKVVEFEMARQAEILDAGGKVLQETRLFDETRSETRPMRTKEDAIDYRYFPDPDIMPLRLPEGFVERIKAAMPELPLARRERFKAEFGLSDYDADQLTSDRALSEYFEAVAKSAGDGKSAANWILSELFAHLARRNLDIKDSPVDAEKLSGLIGLVKDSTVSGKTAKEVLEMMFDEPSKSAAEIVASRGLEQITDTSAIEAAAAKVLSSAPDQVANYRAGKTALFGWFVGQTLKELKGQGNPDLVNKVLKAKLDIPA